VYRPGGYDDVGKPYTLPLLVLKKGENTGIENQNPDRYAVAAADGRWCTPFDYLAVLSSGYGLILVTADSLTVMTPEGDIEKTWTVPEIGIAQSEFDSMLSEIYWGDGGYSGMRRGDYLALGWEPDSDYTKIRCFDLINGGITVMSYEEWESLTVYPDWSQEENTAVPGAELKKDDMLGPDAPGLLSLTEYTDTDVTVTHYLEDGTPLPQFTLYGMKWYQRVAMVGGLIEVLDWNTASYYEADTLECRFRTYLNYEGD